MRPRPPYQASVFRTISESRMLDHLMLCGHAHDIRAGRESQARLSASRALDRWTRRGLGFDRCRTGERLFDPAETMNAFIHAGVRGEDEFWSTRHVATARRLLCDWQGQGAGDGVPTLANLAPRAFRVRLERDYSLAGFPRGATVRLRLPIPLEGPALTGLQLTAQAPHGARARDLQGSIDYQWIVGEQRLVTAGFEATFLASCNGGTGAELTPEQRDTFTRPLEGL